MKPLARPQRRYLRRLATATAGYLLTFALAVRLIGEGVVEGPVAYLVAALPGLAVAGIFWSAGRLLVEETDEYRRMLLVRQSLVATGFALSLATVWGFLENFDLAPQADAFYLVVLWFVGLGVGALYNRLTLGDSDGCL